MDKLPPSSSNTEPMAGCEREDKAALSQWQRIAPIALVYFFISFIRNVAGNFVYLAPAVLLGYNFIQDNPGRALPIVLAIIIVTSVSSLLSYYFFQYRLSYQHIEIRSGVFAKTLIDLPFSRIQNVRFEAPLYYRIFGYVCLQLDTAGSAKQEAKVVALKRDYAERLKQQILATNPELLTANDTEQISEIQSTSVADENVLNRRSLRDIVLHGISNNRVWIVLGGMAPFFDKIIEPVARWLQSVGFDINQMVDVAESPWWQVSLLFMSIFIVVVAVMTLVSILGAIVTFYNFTLSKLGDRYVRRSGLLTQHEVSVKRSRIQLIVRQQHWLDLLFKRCNLTLEQIRSEPQTAPTQEVNSTLLVPSVTESECADLIHDVFPTCEPNKQRYNAISRRFIWRYVGWFVMPAYLIFCTVLMVKQQSELLVWASVIAALLSLLIYLRWRRWGFAIDNEFIYIRTGLIGVTYRCVPTYKIQQTQFKQSVLMKIYGVCNVHIILASGGIEIPFITQAQGYALYNQALLRVEQNERSWM